MSQCLHNCIKLYIICWIYFPFVIQPFDKKKFISFPAWPSTTPIPTCEASQSTSGALSIYGNFYMATLVTLFFRNLNLSSVSLVHMNSLPFIKFVMGATKLQKF